MNYLRLVLELFYLTLRFVAQFAVKSGEGEKRRNPVVRNLPCPVPADSMRKMRDTDLKRGLRRENTGLGLNVL